MFLERLDIFGFKSFAQKTTLAFLPPDRGRFSITGVVGPNGSGKSNTADGIRWVLGEQSMKLLRGKKSEDVIFAGSGTTTRKSVAEVTLTFNNEDRTLEDFGAHIEITRRLYRSGESEYLINKAAVRLNDLVLLLARAHVGQQSYSVIGQGMVDRVVVASPSERKEFFDEATGVREFQIKREQTLAKLTRTRENMREADSVVREIEPRLKTLRRQVTRLAERAEVERALIAVRKQYYGKRWVDLSVEFDRVSGGLKALTKREEQAERARDELLRKMRALEQTQVDAPALENVQKEYDELLTTRQKLQEKSLQLQSAIAIAEAREKKTTPRALIEPEGLVADLEALENEHRALQTSVERRDESAIARALARLGTSIKQLLTRLRTTRTEAEESAPSTAGAQKERDEVRQEMVMIDIRLKEVREQLFAASRDVTTVKSSFFELQRALQEKQEAMRQEERALQEAYINHTRVKTQRESLEQEIHAEAPELLESIRMITPEEVAGVNTAQLQPEMVELRRRVEMIESIEPDVEEEFKTLNERYEFLTGQMQDLSRSLEDLERVLLELERRIASQRASAFEELNKQFQHFFSMLFDGGKAALLQVTAPPPESVEDVPTAVGTETEETDDVEARRDTITGIEIQATPPGKRIQTIHTLSGGERAMTAIALLCAIMTINPSPFVVLDEVDAALDESNSVRFADILRELSAKVQFIVITHNRATMQAANALYGVTMGDDGISSLVSMKLEEAKERIKIPA
ncbi:MAG: AAA family ATPase [Candidatus Magasanikbacteria bacterium]|nr:AAA family ATPase [Candidatus Magasanikbacteria bacterium]